MEYHQNSTLPVSKRTPVEQRQADRSEAAAAGKARLVHPDQAANRGANPRPCDVQSCYRQQAAGLRSGRYEGGRRGPDRICARTSNGAPEKDRAFKPAYLAADTAYGSADTLNWIVNEKKIAPHIPVATLLVPWPRPRPSSNPGAIANVSRCCLRI
jgi:hypothetical protein